MCARATGRLWRVNGTVPRQRRQAGTLTGAVNLNNIIPPSDRSRSLHSDEGVGAPSWSIHGIPARSLHKAYVHSGSSSIRLLRTCHGRQSPRRVHMRALAESAMGLLQVIIAVIVWLCIVLLFITIL